MLHMEKSNMLMLVAEFKLGDMTADDVDKHDTHVGQGRREVDQCFMDSSYSSARSSVSRNFVSSDVVESSISSGTVLNAFTEEIVAYEKESDETHVVKKLDALCTLELFVTHSNVDTPDRTVYYILEHSSDVLLVKGNVYDSVDDCVVAYMKYDAKVRFIVRRSCQKGLRNGDVKQKYLVYNRKVCPKGIHVDTLDLENSEKQKRNSNLHITGCKARAMFNLDPRTRKFVLNVFDTIHNHELEHEEFMHLSKREREGVDLFGASVYCESC
nr:hypothetical protein [Tanacetum cinerariifolium]